MLATDATWTGHLTIQNCRVQNVGTSALPAFLLNVYGNGYVDIENSDFETSSDIQILNADSSSATFNNNLIAANATFPIDKDL